MDRREISARIANALDPLGAERLLRILEAEEDDRKGPKPLNVSLSLVVKWPGKLQERIWIR